MAYGKESLSDSLGMYRNRLNKMRASLQEQIIELNTLIKEVEFLCESELGHKPQEVVDMHGDGFTRCARCWKTLKV